MAREFNPGRKRYRRAPKGDLNETITLPWGEECDRILSVPEFCAKFGVHRNTVRWHRGKRRLDCFKVNYRWYIDMKTSEMPNGYAPGSPDTHHLKGRVQRREPFDVRQKIHYYIEGNGDSNGFMGYPDLYEPLREILGVKLAQDGFTGKFCQPVYNAFQVRLNLSNGGRVFVLCNPENLATAMKKVIGVPIRGATITEAWVPRKIKYV